MFSIFYLFNDGITLIDFGFGQLVYLCYLRIIPGPTLWDNLLFPLHSLVPPLYRTQDRWPDSEDY